MSQPLNPQACESMEKNHPDRVIRVSMKTSDAYQPTREAAMNPENYGLSLDNVSPLGYAIYDYGTLRQRAYHTVAWFVLC